MQGRDVLIGGIRARTVCLAECEFLLLWARLSLTR